MTTQDRSRAQAIEKLGEMIGTIDVAMLTTAAANGSLRSRPMVTQKTPFDGELWFFTRADSAKMAEIEREHHVGLAYADRGSNRYVSISGRARAVRDPQRAKELWSPAHEAWFAKGLEDPSLALLRVSVDFAEYWDGPAEGMVQLAGLATGRGARGDAETGRPGLQERGGRQTPPTRATEAEPAKNHGDPLD